MDTQLLERLQEDGCDTDAESICSVEYINQLKNAISLLNNEAFVKNNWHAPVVSNCLRFMSVGYLFLFLGCQIHEF